MNQSTLDDLGGGRLGIEVNQFLATIVPTPRSLNFIYTSSTFIKRFIHTPLNFFLKACAHKKVTLLFVFPGITHLSSQRPGLDSKEIQRSLSTLNSEKQKDDANLRNMYFSFLNQTEIFKSTLVRLRQIQKDILIEKGVDFITAPYSSEAQLRTLLQEGLISQIFGKPQIFRLLLSEGERIRIIYNIERPEKIKAEEVYYAKRGHQNSISEIENSLRFKTLSLDLGVMNAKESRLSNFAFLCLSFGLLSPRTATLFHSHTLAVEDCALPISVFPYPRIVQQTQVALGVGSRALINKSFLQQATLFCKNLNKEYPIKIEQNDWPGLRHHSILSLYDLITQFQNDQLPQKKLREFKNNADLIASILNQAHLQCFVLLNYIHFDNSIELLYQKIFLEIQQTLGSHKYNSLSLIFLELLQAGLLSYQSLDSANDFINDNIKSEDEKCVRFISRIFSIRHAKFMNSVSTSNTRVDTDLLKFSAVVYSIKESLQTVAEASLCNALDMLIEEDVQFTPKELESLERGGRVFVKDVELSSELGMIIKCILQSESLESIEFQWKDNQKQGTKNKRDFVFHALRETYEQVWRRVQILFKVVQRHHRLNSEFEQLIERSSSLLREKLEPLF